MSDAAPLNVLFLCTGNSARSILAEAIMNREGRGRFHAYSAGSHPKGAVNPNALGCWRACTTRPTPCARSRGTSSRDRTRRSSISCSRSATTRRPRCCPIWPGQPMTAHWGMPDPAAVMGSPAEIALAFADTYRMLNNRITPVHQPAAGHARQAVAAAAAGRDRPAARGGAARLMTDVTAWSATPAWSRRSQPYGLAARAGRRSPGDRLLLAIVIGSGIMGERLCGGNDAIALLGNTLATGAGLVVLITIFGPLSGAHFNPAVTLVFALRREIAWTSGHRLRRGADRRGRCWESGSRTPCSPSRSCRSRQAAGRSGAGARRVRRDVRADRRRSWARCGSGPTSRPWMVGLYITSAYWFTASTSFANPAVTMARCLRDTFAGIAPASAPAVHRRPARGRASAAGGHEMPARRTSGPLGQNLDPEAQSPRMALAMMLRWISLVPA